MRRAIQPATTEAEIKQPNWPTPSAIIEDDSPNVHHNLEETIKLYPDVGLALLRHEQTAAGRVWLLLRHLDEKGQGWLTLSQIRQWLTVANSPYRICGERQLRNLLNRGENLFWHKAGNRIWLRATSKVAEQLNLRRLTTRPVQLPVKPLLRGIGHFRAELYAAFHSGRNGNTAKPIARATMQAICRVSRRSQRNYERRAGIRCQRNIAIGELNNTKNRERRGTQHGRALFTLADKIGKQGSAGTQYLAWQLPNSYIGPHKPAPPGGQKRINHTLTDLFMQGMTGNSVREVDQTAQPKRRFQANGAQAARQFNRDSKDDLYWPNRTGGSDRTQLWHLLSGQTKANEG